MHTQNHCKLFSPNQNKRLFITILRYSRRHVIHDIICNRQHSACCCCFGLTNHSEAASLWLVRQDRATINSGSLPSCGANFCSDRWLHRPRWVGWPVRYLDIYLFYVYGYNHGKKFEWRGPRLGGYWSLSLSSSILSPTSPSIIAPALFHPFPSPFIFSLLHKSSEVWRALPTGSWWSSTANGFWCIVGFQVPYRWWYTTDSFIKR